MARRGLSGRRGDLVCLLGNLFLQLIRLNGRQRRANGYLLGDFSPAPVSGGVFPPRTHMHTHTYSHMYTIYQQQAQEGLQALAGRAPPPLSAVLALWSSFVVVIDRIVLCKLWLSLHRRASTPFPIKAAAARYIYASGIMEKCIYINFGSGRDKLPPPPSPTRLD
jgi:hypothetical protein